MAPNHAELQVLRPSGPVRRQGALDTIWSNLDLMLLVVLMMVDIRVLKGSSVASFTLFELFVWCYCVPYVISFLCLSSERLPLVCEAFLLPIALYIGWILVAAIIDLVLRGDSSVLQNAKNITLALSFSTFLLIRIRSIEIVASLFKLYVLYCLIACLFGFLQNHFGGPYLFELISGTEYKLDIDGNIISNPVVGLFTHPNTFAVALLPAVIFTVLKLTNEILDGMRLRLHTIAAVVVLITAMVLTQARGETIFTAAGILFGLSPLGRARSFTLKFALVSSLITAITVYSLQWAAETGAPGAGTIETRYLLWLTSIYAMASDIFILLFGGGTKFVTYWSLQISGWEFPDAHNAWLDQALYFGIPAVLLYLRIWIRFLAIVVVDSHHVSFSRQGNLFIRTFQAIVFAMMGVYFFEPFGNAVFMISQLFFFMSLGVRVASFGVQDVYAANLPKKKVLTYLQ